MKLKKNKKYLIILSVLVSILILYPNLKTINDNKNKKFIIYIMSRYPNISINHDLFDKVRSMKANNEYYKLFDIDFFKDRKLKYPKEIKFNKTDTPFKRVRNQINYTFEDTIDYEDLFIFKFQADSVSLGSLNFSLKKYWYNYKIKDNTLFIKFDEDYEPFIRLTEEPLSYITRVGKFVSMGKKNVSFFDYEYKDIFELHYIWWNVESSNPIAIQTFWFNDEFELIRLERITDGIVKIP